MFFILKVNITIYLPPAFSPSYDIQYASLNLIPIFVVSYVVKFLSRTIDGPVPLPRISMWLITEKKIDWILMKTYQISDFITNGKSWNYI